MNQFDKTCRDHSCNCLSIWLSSFMSNGQKSVAEKTFSLPSKTTAPYIQGIRHLLDDSVLEESPCASSDGSICGKILSGQTFIKWNCYRTGPTFIKWNCYIKSMFNISWKYIAILMKQESYLLHFKIISQIMVRRLWIQCFLHLIPSPKIKCKLKERQLLQNLSFYVLDRIICGVMYWYFSFSVQNVQQRIDSRWVEQLPSKLYMWRVLKKKNNTQRWEEANGKWCATTKSSLPDFKLICVCK